MWGADVCGCAVLRILRTPRQVEPEQRHVEVAEEVEAPSEPEVRKRKLRLRYLVPAAVVVAVAVAASLVLMGGDEPSYDLEATMTRLASGTAEVWADADRASTLGQLTSVGESAEQTSARLGELRKELVEVGDADDRRVAEAAFAAQIEALDALAILATLEAEDVAEWLDVNAEIQETVEAITAAELELVERELPGSPDLAGDVEAAGERIGVAVASISEKLDAWAAEVERINADKFAQQLTLDEYEEAFRAQLERYAGLRSSLGDLTTRVVNEGGTYSTAYADLGAALAQRREVHAAMSALVPPSALVPAHTAIVSAVQDSTAAVQSAITGVEEHQWDYYYTIDSTPGWQAFERASEQVGNAYNGGVGAWEAAIAAEEARIAEIKTPAQPAV